MSSVGIGLVVTGVPAGFCAGFSCSVAPGGAGSEDAVLDAGAVGAGAEGGAKAGTEVGLEPQLLLWGSQLWQWWQDLISGL